MSAILLIIIGKDTKDYSYFLSWPDFISSVGRILFPQLAVFYFLSWPNFVSTVGSVLLACWDTYMIMYSTIIGYQLLYYIPYTITFLIC